MLNTRIFGKIFPKKKTKKLISILKCFLFLFDYIFFLAILAILKQFYSILIKLQNNYYREKYGI